MLEEPPIITIAWSLVHFLPIRHAAKFLHSQVSVNFINIFLRAVFVQIFGVKLKRNLASKIRSKNVDEIDTKSASHKKGWETLL